MIFEEDYQLAAGQDNTGGLVAIETILAGYGTLRPGMPAAPPLAVGRFSSGTAVLRGSGTLFLRGFPFQDWLFSFMLWAQIGGLRTNFCSGGYSGAVTLRTQTDSIGTFANWNATLTLKQLGEYPSNQHRRTGIENYVLSFSRMVAI